MVEFFQWLKINHFHTPLQCLVTCEISQIVTVEIKTNLPSIAAAPPSVSDLTNIPNFSTPVSVPTPKPIILNPRPLSSENGKNMYNVLRIQLELQSGGETKGSFNPLTPMSDQDRISPNNINTTSNRQVMRIKKNIS